MHFEYHKRGGNAVCLRIDFHCAAVISRIKGIQIVRLFSGVFHLKTGEKHFGAKVKGLRLNTWFINIRIKSYAKNINEANIFTMSYHGGHVRDEDENWVAATCWFSKSNSFRCGKF